LREEIQNEKGGKIEKNPVFTHKNANISKNNGLIKKILTSIDFLSNFTYNIQI